ncbi:MLO-like protein 13 isoform X1 [Oryza sativa Japonica Group]|uniref:MLO-like protein 13 isoform X1 n=1 Tax=Oryza sativa subsp. japonica TaxID=39947 RepID=UPI00339C8370
MGAGEGGEEQSLALTPTWVVAGVCFIIVAISLAAERLLHRLGKVLKFNGQEALFSALQRVKEELMLLGFISFLLSVFQKFINHICIPESAAHLMLPCITRETSETTEDASKLCKRKGEVPMLSEEALHQLHIFIFVLGIVHVVFCVTTLLLGGAKMKKWEKWEKEIQQGRTKERPKRPGWMKFIVVRCAISFLKQFYDSVGKPDYQVLRSAFVQRHYPNRPDFDFHKYMVRALEHDFKEVVGISWYLWLFVIVFLLLNINGWHTYFWLSFLPLILLLIVGTKLELISTRLAQEAADCPDEATGNPWTKPCKEHFWFSKPRIVLHLIHFILFQNSFEMGFFFWVLATYGFDSCIMENKIYALPRLAIGIIVQVLCSYSTLPLYAIVTHMGGDIKLQAFGETVHVSVHSWATDVRKKKAAPPPHSHLRIPFLMKRRHSTRGADDAADDAGGDVDHHHHHHGHHHHGHHHHEGSAAAARPTAVDIIVYGSPSRRRPVPTAAGVASRRHGDVLLAE